MSYLNILRMRNGISLRRSSYEISQKITLTADLTLCMLPSSQKDFRTGLFLFYNSLEARKWINKHSFRITRRVLLVRQTDRSKSIAMSCQIWDIHCLHTLTFHLQQFPTASHISNSVSKFFALMKFRRCLCSQSNMI